MYSCLSSDRTTETISNIPGFMGIAVTDGTVFLMVSKVDGTSLLLYVYIEALFSYAIPVTKR